MTTLQVFNGPAFFVVSTGRAGTTFLADVIQGPSIHCLKEYEVASRLPEYGGRHLFHVYYRGGMSHEEFLSIAYRARKPLIEALPRGNAYCEKIPVGIFFISELLELFPNAWFLELVRDGRDVAQSLVNQGYFSPRMTRPQWLPKGDLGWWHVATPFERACYYVKCCRLQSVRNRHWLGPDRYRLLRYEDLCRSYESCVEQLEVHWARVFNRPLPDLRPAKAHYKDWAWTQSLSYCNVMGELGLWVDRLMGYDIKKELVCPIIGNDGRS